VFLVLLTGALVVAGGYAWLLARFTDAYAPVPDALVLVLSVLGQLLLVDRRLETWWCWLAVNGIAVPLYASRGLLMTALLYTGFLVNAWVSLRSWRNSASASPAAVSGSVRSPCKRDPSPWTLWRRASSLRLARTCRAATKRSAGPFCPHPSSARMGRTAGHFAPTGTDQCLFAADGRPMWRNRDLSR
jgi:hypothetical protein